MMIMTMIKKEKKKNNIIVISIIITVVVVVFSMATYSIAKKKICVSLNNEIVLLGQSH